MVAFAVVIFGVAVSRFRSGSPSSPSGDRRGTFLPQASLTFAGRAGRLADVQVLPDHRVVTAAQRKDVPARVATIGLLDMRADLGLGYAVDLGALVRDRLAPVLGPVRQPASTRAIVLGRAVHVADDHRCLPRTPLTCSPPRTERITERAPQPLPPRLYRLGRHHAAGAATAPALA